jgi:hypothetical protein
MSIKVSFLVHNGNRSIFKFELEWLLRDGFADMVTEIWDSVTDEEDSMKR